jgi:hypothetical protein
MDYDLGRRDLLKALGAVGVTTTAGCGSSGSSTEGTTGTPIGDSGSGSNENEDDQTADGDVQDNAPGSQQNESNVGNDQAGEGIQNGSGSGKMSFDEVNRMLNGAMPGAFHERAAPAMGRTSNGSISYLAAEDGSHNGTFLIWRDVMYKVMGEENTRGLVATDLGFWAELDLEADEAYHRLISHHGDGEGWIESSHGEVDGHYAKAVDNEVANVGDFDTLQLSDAFVEEREGDGSRVYVSGVPGEGPIPIMQVEHSDYESVKNSLPGPLLKEGIQEYRDGDYVALQLLAGQGYDGPATLVGYDKNGEYSVLARAED